MLVLFGNLVEKSTVSFVWLHVLAKSKKETETKLKKRILKTSIFGAVVEVKGIGEVLDCTKFSSIDKILRITNVLKFIRNLRAKPTKF